MTDKYDEWLYEIVYSGLQGQNFLFNEVPRGDEDEGKDV